MRKHPESISGYKLPAELWHCEDTNKTYKRLTDLKNSLNYSRPGNANGEFLVHYINLLVRNPRWTIVLKGNDYRPYRSTYTKAEFQAARIDAEEGNW